MQRKAQWLIGLVFAIGLLLGPARSAGAQSIAGQIVDGGGLPVAGAEVRLWSEGTKGWSIEFTTGTDAAGNYAFTGVPPGDYKLDARRATNGCFDADRWYDLAHPWGDGWTTSTADVITIGPADNLTGYDIQMLPAGGMDGTVDSGGTPLPNVHVRVEHLIDWRIHHNDMTDDVVGRLGEFFMCGLIPGDYRFIVYDPSALRETGIFLGPYLSTPAVQSSLGVLSLATMGADGNEPNDSLAGGTDLDACLAGAPVGECLTSGTIIAPRGSDVDYFCFSAAIGDRYFISTETFINVDGEQRLHPWIDPAIALFDSGGQRIAENDDDPVVTAGLNSWIDTGALPSTGRYCVAVTMFGDLGSLTGTNQIGGGRYALRFEQGPRPPWLNVDHLGSPAPIPPLVITINEGDTLVLDLTYGDPDNDPLTVTAEHVDINAAPVLGGLLEVNPGAGTFTWNTSPSASLLSPYEMTFRATDGLDTAVRRVLVVVTGLNQPPSVPTLLDPPNDGRIGTATPDLVLINSTDPDGDPITYQYQAYLEGTSTATLDATEAEQPAQTTHVVANPFPEDTWVLWRARACDGQASNACSVWTNFWRFLVDASDLPPPAPVLIKPGYDELLLVDRPSLSATNIVEPDGDAVTYLYEVALDEQFSNVIRTSPLIAMNTLGNVTNWNVDPALDWGGTYYARVLAEDDGGSQSPWSNVVRFHLVQGRPGQGSDSPSFRDPLDTNCDSQAYCDAAPTSFSVDNLQTQSPNPVVYQFQIWNFNDDPADPTASPILDETIPEDTANSFTEWTVDPAVFTDDRRYFIRVRAHTGVYSEWTTCNFLVNLDNRSPGPPQPVSPEDGATVPEGNVTITVTNPNDPDGAATGTRYIAYCIDDNPDLSNCPATYPGLIEQSSTDPGSTTSFDEGPFFPGETIYVGLYAIDDCGGESARAVFSFVIEGGSSGKKSGCGCTASSGPDAGGALLILLAFVVLFRRRRD